MKRISNVVPAQSWAKRLMMLFTSIFVAMISFAQDKKIDVDINTDKGGGNFFASPIVWVIGAAVFILLLVALLRGSGSRSDA